MIHGFWSYVGFWAMLGGIALGIIALASYLANCGCF